MQAAPGMNPHWWLLGQIAQILIMMCLRRFPESPGRSPPACLGRLRPRKITHRNIAPVPRYCSGIGRRIDGPYHGLID
jgi:hypothetical protein